MWVLKHNAVEFEYHKWRTLISYLLHVKCIYVVVVLTFCTTTHFYCCYYIALSVVESAHLFKLKFNLMLQRTQIKEYLPSHEFSSPSKASHSSSSFFSQNFQALQIIIITLLFFPTWIYFSVKVEKMLLLKPLWN